MGQVTALTIVKVGSPDRGDRGAHIRRARLLRGAPSGERARPGAAGRRRFLTALPAFLVAARVSRAPADEPPAPIGWLAGYAKRLLDGARPGELPIERPTTFELVVNKHTADAIAVTLPPNLLARADAVIQ